MKMKRTMALFLAAVLTFSALPFGSQRVYAEENEAAAEYVTEVSDASEISDEQSVGSQPGSEELTESSEEVTETDTSEISEEESTDADETAEESEVSDETVTDVTQATFTEAVEEVPEEAELVQLTPEQNAKYAAVKQQILSAIEGWPAEEKLLYIHDYIVTHCEWDSTSNLDNNTAYGALVGGATMDKGYALAFKDLATSAGISADVVKSVVQPDTYPNSYRHWNRVELDEQYYYIDVAADDLKDYYEMCCSHDCFLCTRDEINNYRDNNYSSFGWVPTYVWLGEDGENKYPVGGTDTTFSSAPWRASGYSAVACFDGYIIYIDAATRKVMKYAFAESASVELCSNGPVGWGTNPQFATVVTDGTYTFINDGRDIYRLQSGDTYTLVKVNNDSDNKIVIPDVTGAAIYGIRLSADATEIEYWLATGYQSSNVIDSSGESIAKGPTGSVSLDGVMAAAPRVVIEEDSVVLAEGETKKLTAKVMTGTDEVPGAVIGWSSSDKGVVTVASDGTLNAIAYGQAVITAASNGAKKAECVVQVNSKWQEDYIYEVEGEDLILSKYKGTGNVVNVPAEAYVGGKKCNTVLGYNHSTNKSVFNSNSDVTAITIASGVRFETDSQYGSFSAAYAFAECPELLTVDLSGVDLTGVTSTYGMFNRCPKLKSVKMAGAVLKDVKKAGFMFGYCPKLESVDLSGCDLSKLSKTENDNQYMFSGSDKIAEIKTPAKCNTGVTVTLPNDMYEMKDGKLQTTKYTNLMKAPVNSVIATNASAVVTKTELTAEEYELTLDAESFEFTGSPIKPKVTVTKRADGKKLTEYKDYVVGYDKNKNVGTGTVYAAGIGNYTGTLEKDFSITKTQQKVAVDYKGITKLAAGRSITVTVTGAETDITFNSSDTEVATIVPSEGSNAILTALKKGSTRITVSCAASADYEAFKKEFDIEVTTAPRIGIKFSASPEENGVYVEKYAMAAIEAVELDDDDNELGTVAGAEIYYTLNGDNPSKTAYELAVADDDAENCSTKKYTGAIVIDKPTVTVNAVVYKEGYKNTGNWSHTYSLDPENWGSLGETDDSVITGIKDVLDHEGGLSKVPDGLWYVFAQTGDNHVRITAGEYGGVNVKSTIGDAPVTYTGDKITFNEEIYVFHGTRRLIENRDYTVSYANNINAFSLDSLDVPDKAGKEYKALIKKTPSVTIKGKGNYNGSETFYFTINPVSMDKASVTSEAVVPVAAGAKVKLGNTKPTVVFGGKKLTLNKDYELRYYKGEGVTGTAVADPAKEILSTPGETYTIQIAGKAGSNYSEEMTATVTVKTIDGSDKTIVQTSKLKVGDIKGKTITVPYDADKTYSADDIFDGANPVGYVFVKKAEQDALTYGDDYEVELTDGDNNSAGRHGFVITGKGKYVGTKTGTYEIAGIPASKVKVAGLVSTAEYCADAFSCGANIVDGRLFNSADKVITARNWTRVTLYTTTGSGRNTEYKELVPGTDYTVTMDNTGVTGKFNVIFNLKGSYTGTIKKTVTVKAFNMTKNAGDLVTVVPSAAKYSKGGAKPESLAVKFNGKDLTEGVDYTVSYKNNTKVCTELTGKSLPAVTIKGKGNFTGSLTGNFVIAPVDVRDAVTLTLSDKVYKKNAAKNYFKSPLVFMDGGKQVTEGKNKDITVVKDSIVYSYAEDIPDKGIYRGQIINDKDVVPAGAVIKVTCSVEVTEANNPKSYYVPTTVPVQFSAAYRMLDTGKDISKASVSTKVKFAYNNTGNIPMTAGDFTLKLNGKNMEPGTYKIKSVTDNRYLGTATVVFEGLGEYGGTKSYKVKINAKSMK